MYLEFLMIPRNDVCGGDFAIGVESPNLVFETLPQFVASLKRWRKLLKFKVNRCWDRDTLIVTERIQHTKIRRLCRLCYKVASHSQARNA